MLLHVNNISALTTYFRLGGRLLFATTVTPGAPTKLKLSMSSSTSSNDSFQNMSASEFSIAQYINFPLDDWQLQAGNEILKGNNVIACAPTGADKTVVKEIALYCAFANDKDAIYTTPLKALSNQKFMELQKKFWC